MAFIVKNILEKPQADVLLEHYLGPLGNVFDIFSDSKVLSVQYQRSDDKSYAEILMFWESEKTYHEWDKLYEIDHKEGKSRMEQYHKDMNIRFETHYPPYTDLKQYKGNLNKIDFNAIFTD